MTTVNWLEISTHNCSIQRTLALVGEKWTLLIIRDAMNGVRRFDDLRRHVGLSEPVLADRLRKLVAAGILETRPYRAEGQRSRLEYRLTDKGLDLHAALVALMQWGDRYLADPGGPPIEVLHADCGAPVRAVVQCTGEHVEVGPRSSRIHALRGARRLGASY
jgi:DNA-binding HxlR family transcriptional regulator